MPLTRAEANALMAAVRAAIAPYVEHAQGAAPAPVETVTTPKAPNDPNDPTVRILPNSWRGVDYRGRRFSECEPKFLGQLARILDASADRNESDTDPQKQKFARWDRERAQKAREWRARLEGKGGQQPALPSVEQLADEGAL